MSYGTGSVYQRANGKWIATLDLPPGPDGKRRRRTVTGKTKAEAIRKRKQLDPTTPTDSITLNNWIDQWIDSPATANLKPKTKSGYITEIERRIKPTLGHILLTKLAPRHTAVLADAYQRAGLSSTTAKLGHRVLSRILRDAARAGHVDRNIADATYSDAPRKVTHEVRMPTDEEMRSLIEAAKASARPARWLATLLTGARRSELLGLEADRVDLAGGTLTLDWQLQRLPVEHGCGGSCGKVRAADCPDVVLDAPADFEVRRVRGSLFLTRPKSAAGCRVVPMVEPLWGAMGELLSDGRRGLVWSGVGESLLTPEADSGEWKVLAAVAGVGGLRQHDARHVAATLMMAGGVDVRVVQEVVGHSSAAMSRYYQHVDVGLRRRALEVVAAGFAA